MSTRVMLTALALLLAPSACVPVPVDSEPERDVPTTGGSGGTGGAPSMSGGVGGSAGGGNGGMAGLDPANPRGGNGGTGATGLPQPNVNAIFETGCATATVEAELPQVNLLFVLDRSESMICAPPPTMTSVGCESDPTAPDAGIETKWEITRDALTAVIQALPPQTVVGISYFSNDDMCGVHSRPRIPLRALVPAQITAIDASLSNVTPNGRTPLVGATILAYRHLHEAALAGDIKGERFVVLLTDGEQSDNCNDARCGDKATCTTLLVDEVEKASGQGVQIRTFVIGVPGSEGAREVLSTIAQRGGTAPPDCDADAGTCHFDMSEEPDLGPALSMALDQIVGRALSCELPLPDSDDLDRNRVNVVYSSSLGEPPRVIPRDDSKPSCGEGVNGWQYAVDGRSIQLCGEPCEAARKDGGGRMDVVLGCPFQVPD